MNSFSYMDFFFSLSRKKITFSMAGIQMLLVFQYRKIKDLVVSKRNLKLNRISNIVKLNFNIKIPRS